VEFIRDKKAEDKKRLKLAREDEIAKARERLRLAKQVSAFGAVVKCFYASLTRTGVTAVFVFVCACLFVGTYV
jgi:hypothetical protein